MAKVFPDISLAAKCRLLFGAAVLAILTAALFLPGARMEHLVNQLNCRQVRQNALSAAARCDLGAGLWSDLERLRQEQDRLARWWQHGARNEGLEGPVPRLVPATAHVPVLSRFLERFADRPVRQRFIRKSIEAFVKHPKFDDTYETDKDQPDRVVYRCALAVRSTGGEQPPGTLLGIVYAEYAATRADEKIWWNRFYLIAAGLLSGILAILVFYLITQKLILSPVRKLRRVAQKVADGDLDARSHIGTGDEFQHLGDTFNLMLESLRNSQKKLETINRSLDTRLGELAEANVALFEANKLKTEFLTNVSHELRTPLVSIIGFADLLKESSHYEADARLRRYVDNVSASGHQLLALISDLLDLAKVEAGQIELHRSHFDPAQVCTDVMDFLRPQADNKKLTLVDKVPGDLPAMHSDSAKLRQILFNLLSNAIKFTPDGGAVTMDAAATDPDHLRISVADTGPGIPYDQQEHVFEKFRQLDGSVTRRHGGTGLGLAISRNLAQLLGGTLMLESTPGAGSIFTVALPLECPERVDMPLVRLT